MSTHGQRTGHHGTRVSAEARAGQLHVDAKRLANYLKARVPGIVQQRTLAGLDSRGKAFKPYSSSYATARLRAGRSAKPSLSLTGGMVNSYGLRSARLVGTTITLFFGPASTSSAGVTLTDKGAQMSGRRSPPHNILGMYHEIGAGNLPRRRWIGLSERELETLAREVEALKGIWALRR